MISGLDFVLISRSGADPGFPRQGRQPKERTPTYYLVKIYQKLHENEENWTKGAHVQNFTL